MDKVFVKFRSGPRLVDADIFGLGGLVDAINFLLLLVHYSDKGAVVRVTHEPGPQGLWRIDVEPIQHMIFALDVEIAWAADFYRSIKVGLGLLSAKKVLSLKLMIYKHGLRCLSHKLHIRRRENGENICELWLSKIYCHRLCFNWSKLNLGQSLFGTPQLLFFLFRRLKFLNLLRIFTLAWRSMWRLLLYLMQYVIYNPVVVRHSITMHYDTKPVHNF